MAAPYSSSWSRTAGRLYWRPPGGIGNGLDAQTWAALIDADASELILLLDTLRDAASPRTRPGSTGWAHKPVVGIPCLG